MQSNDAQSIQQHKYFYHSYEQWVDNLGIYSVSTIKRLVSKLKTAGILVVKKLSQTKWIQTNFYSINYRKLSTLLKGPTESIDVEELDETQVQLLTPPSPTIVKRSRATTTVPAPAQTIVKAKIREGLISPLEPMASPAILEAMSAEKRGLYNRLLQLKVDIHYDDARLDEWLKQKKFIVHKAAYLKDQLGHLKMRWYRPEQIGLQLT